MMVVADRKPLNVYNLWGPVIRIGRDAGMEIVIDNIAVSREQAEVRQEGGVWRVRDLGSANGSFLNGERLSKSEILRPGDEISFGKFAVLFEPQMPEAPAVATTSGAPVPSLGATLALDPEEAQRLIRAAALKRLAQLQWQLGRQRGTHSIEGGVALVGRSPVCDLRIRAGGPMQYVLVARGKEGFEVRNLSRWFRMRVNGQPAFRVPLREGDAIQIGRLHLTFREEVR
jgi:pSer/pThr/pTyr-binding forkhead associated (FHA) protein